MKPVVRCLRTLPIVSTLMCQLLVCGLLYSLHNGNRGFLAEQRQVASEGLHGSSIPSGLTKPWKATALLILRDKKDHDFLIGSATAFAIKKERIADHKVRITFLTNNHNVSGKSCGDGFDCKNARLSISLNYALNMKENTIDKMGTPAFEVPLEFPRDNAETDKDRDLAIVSGVFSKSQADQFEVIGLSCEETCQNPGTKIFVLGFPAVQNRLAGYQSTPIDDPERIKKRWSEGFTTAQMYKTDAVSNLIPMGTSTADSLTGNSGSPVVTAGGRLCGVYTGGWIDGRDHHKYEGDDKKLKFHSVHTTCQELKRSSILARYAVPF